MPEVVKADRGEPGGGGLLRLVAGQRVQGGAEAAATPAQPGTMMRLHTQSRFIRPSLTRIKYEHT